MTVASISIPLTMFCPWCGADQGTTKAATMIAKYKLNDFGRSKVQNDTCSACGQRFGVVLKSISFREVRT